MMIWFVIELCNYTETTASERIHMYMTRLRSCDFSPFAQHVMQLLLCFEIPFNMYRALNNAV